MFSSSAIQRRGEISRSWSYRYTRSIVSGFSSLSTLPMPVPKWDMSIRTTAVSLSCRRTLVSCLLSLGAVGFPLVAMLWISVAIPPIARGLVWVNGSFCASFLRRRKNGGCFFVALFMVREMKRSDGGCPLLRVWGNMALRCTGPIVV